MDTSPLLCATRRRSYPFDPHQRVQLSSRRFLLSVAAFLAIAKAVAAQNAITDNAEFDGNWDGWYNLPAQTSTWDVEDADGCAQSGHFQADSTGQGPGETSYAAVAHPNCLPVAVGDHVFQQVAYKSTHAFRLYLWFYSDSACATDLGDNFADASLFPPGPWAVAFRETTVPTGVASVRFAAGAFDDLGNQPSAGFDRAYLGLADRVFSDDFSAGSTCRWSSAAGTLESWR